MRAIIASSSSRLGSSLSALTSASEMKLSLEQTALDLRPCSFVLRKLGEHLGRLDRALEAERDRRRATEQLVEVAQLGSGGRATGQAVLDHPELHSLLATLAAQLVDVGHREATEVSEDQPFALAASSRSGVRLRRPFLDVPFSRPPFDARTTLEPSRFSPTGSWSS